MSLTSETFLWVGASCNGVTLGDPAVIETDGTVIYVWDDSAFPDGTINEKGDVIAVGDDGQQVVVGKVERGG